MTKAVQIMLPVLTMLLAAQAVADEPAMRLYIAPGGNDTSSGRTPTTQGSDRPFGTIQRARDEIRKIRKSAGLPKGGISVELAPGVYEIAKAIEFGPDDSGTADSPIVYTGRPTLAARVSGGRIIPSTSLKPVTDPIILNRLDEPARGKVMQVDLKALGLTDFGEVAKIGERIELFFAGRPMTLARWPNEGFTKIAEVTGGQPIKVHGVAGDKVGKFTWEGDRPARWKDEPDFWLHGYWFWDWADEYQKIASLDPATKTIALAGKAHTYGYRKGQRYYAMNLLCELDSPGEWYLDRASGMLYFWPPADPATGELAVSVTRNLFALKNASYVTLRNLTLHYSRHTPIEVSGGQGVRIEACTVRNVGGWAISITNGQEHRVVGCDLSNLGEGGVWLAGGDRKMLTAAGHVAENNHIHHFSRLARTYRPAFQIEGVGQRVAHNLIHDTPHDAIQLGGNEHVIEFNEIYNACYETGDVGAFYMGRDWTARGTIIRHNYFHHIKGPGLYGANAVYLDDAASGITVYGNVFYKAGRAAFIGGGRDNTIENNIFVDCDASVHIDARGLGWMKDAVEPKGVLQEQLRAMPYQQPPWSERYSQLLTVLADQPGAPKGNIVARNISWGGKWLDVEKLAAPLVKFENNLTDKDPQFVDAAKQNFQLRESSPAYGLGFKRIPIDQIGLTRSLPRASWPQTAPDGK